MSEKNKDVYKRQLYKRDVDAAAVVHRLAEGSRRLDSEVALITGKRRAIDAAGDAFAVCERDGHIVVELSLIHI